MASHLIWLLLCSISSFICGIAAAILFHLIPRRTSSSSSSTATCPPDSAAASSSSVDHPQIKYDVFLSFRGTDTRSGFLSHLLQELSRKKIDYFVDDQKLNQGDEISATLLSAIRRSEISLVVFSKDYADSKWCLEELEQIIQCRENQKQIVVPVFYQVDPSTVRHQKESYKNALDKLGKRFGKHELQKWRISLKKAADLSGFVSSEYPSEEILMKEIVERVSEELRKMGNQIDLEGFVGIQNHIEDLEKLLHKESQDIFIIGIWGMGGVGKTTIVEILYNRLHNKYDGGHFLCVKEELEIHGGKKQLKRDLLSKLLLEKKDNFDDVNLHGIPTWVKRRLNRKKILVVLDDINASDQLEILTGGHEWFGSGSRIIMTSRDKHLFSGKCDKIYEVKPLNPKDANQLFEKTLTKKCHVREQERYELSKKVLNYAQGVPLTINILARFLYDKNKDEWKSKLEKLEEKPDSNVQNVLELSYNGLNDCEHKEIFLHLACFFRKGTKMQITMLLDACGYHTIDGLKALQDKALITISDLDVCMHDLIRAMGCEIVRKKSLGDLGRCTHLFNVDDIYKVFENQMGTGTIKSIRLEIWKLKRDLHLGPQAFSKMNNIRLLQFDGENEDRYMVYPHEEGFDSLPNELRYFGWSRYPSKSFPLRFCVNNLVELCFKHSKLQRLWDGVQELPSLRVLDLSSSYELIELPHLSKAPNLEMLDLFCCHNITEIPDSLYLPSLKYLDLTDTMVETLPESFTHLSELINLNLAECSRLRYIPKLQLSIGFLSASGCELLETLQFTWTHPEYGLDINLYNCMKLDDRQLEAVARRYILTTKRIISASIKDGYAQLYMPVSKRYNSYWATQGSVLASLELPLHSRAMGFIFCFVIILQDDGDISQFKIKCHVELSNVAKVEFICDGPEPYDAPTVLSPSDISDHVLFWYGSNLGLKIMEEVSRIKASATTNDLCAKVKFELLEMKSEWCTVKEWGCKSFFISCESQDLTNKRCPDINDSDEDDFDDETNSL